MFPQAPLPFWTRDIYAGRRRLSSEAMWNRSDEDSRAVLVEPAAAGLDQYRSDDCPIPEAPPGVVKALLRSGLSSRFEAFGCFVENNKFSFSCFDRDPEWHDETPDFLRLQQGVTFWADHLTGFGSRLYGFFVHIEVRATFRPGLEDDLLAGACVGETVQVQSAAGVRAGKLRAINTDTAEIEIDGLMQRIPRGAVIVPANPHVIERYCRARGTPHLKRRAYLAEQAASYRLKGGRRNRKWLLDRCQYVGSWLAMHAQAGGIRFPWPNSQFELLLRTEPIEVLAGSLP